MGGLVSVTPRPPRWQLEFFGSLEIIMSVFAGISETSFRVL